MIDFFQRLFDVSDFTPRERCGNWTSDLIWLHRGSDLFVWLAYVSIPLALIFFAWKRRAIPFRSLFWLFAAFILACGSTHFVEALMFTWPAYRLSGLIKFGTAVVSWVTVAALIPALPSLLSLSDRFETVRLSDAGPRPRAIDFILALTAAGVAVLIRGALGPLVGDHPLMVVPLLAVMLVAWLSGFWPSMLTLVTSLTAVIFFFVQPTASFGVEKLSDQLGAALFFFCGVGCAVLGEAQRTARRRAETALTDSLRQRNELAAEVERRVEIERVLRQREAELLRINAELRASQEALAERARLSAFTARASAALVTVKGMRETLQQCAEAIVEGLDAAFARVWSLDEGENVLKLLASAGQYTHLDGPHARVPVGRFKIGLIAQERVPHLTNDVASDERVGDPEWAQREGMRAFAGYPLVVQDRLVGVVALFSKQPLSPSTLDALGTVADALALRMQRARVERDLRDSREQMQTLADSIPPMTWMARPDGHIFWYKKRWYDYTGTTPEQMEGWGWRAVHDQELLPGIEAKFRAHLATGEPWEDTFPLRRHDGEMRHFLSRARPVRDETGQIVRWFGTNSDVEEQRRLAEALRQSAERFRLVLETMPTLVWTSDAAGELTYFNQRWIEFTGVTLEQGRGEGWRTAIHPDDAAGLAANWAAAIATGEPVSYEYRIRRQSDGDYRWHVSHAVPLRDEGGTIVQWIGSAADVDAQKRQAEHLERLVRQRTAKLTQEIAERVKAEKLVESVLAELRRSNGELEQFAYVASHDLQEPLRKIQAFGDRLKVRCRDGLGEQGQDYVDRMQNSAARMQQLIDDLLTFSRVSTRGQDFRDVDLAAVARDVISDLEGRILKTEGTVNVGPLPSVRADSLQMRQLLQNLIGNALKFHRPGVPSRVEVSAAVEGDVCRLTVSDNGIGFEERYLDRIFQVFQRLHGRDAYEGTGVGLAICKKIAERHGGSIAARSTPGVGSTFVVTIPTDATEAGNHDRDAK